jgi:hypothetical protein
MAKISIKMRETILKLCGMEKHEPEFAKLVLRSQN